MNLDFWNINVNLLYSKAHHRFLCIQWTDSTNSLIDTIITGAATTIQIYLYSIANVELHSSPFSILNSIIVFAKIFLKLKF